MRRLLSTLSALALVAAGTLAVVAPASAETHCATTVTGQTADGELILSDPVCFSGDGAQLAAVRAVTSSDAELIVAGGTVDISLAGSQVLGVHYDGASWTGSSITVVGSGTCNGGWTNLSSSWTNRVSSTINGVCYRVKHHDYFNKGGTFQSTWGGGGNLSYMNNRANSISYNAS